MGPSGLGAPHNAVAHAAHAAHAAALAYAREPRVLAHARYSLSQDTRARDFFSFFLAITTHSGRSRRSASFRKSRGSQRALLSPHLQGRGHVATAAADAAARPPRSTATAERSNRHRPRGRAHQWGPKAQRGCARGAMRWASPTAATPSISRKLHLLLRPPEHGTNKTHTRTSAGTGGVSLKDF